MSLCEGSKRLEPGRLCACRATCAAPCAGHTPVCSTPCAPNRPSPARLQSSLREKTKQLKAMASELNMYQAQVGVATGCERAVLACGSWVQDGWREVG